MSDESYHFKSGTAILTVAAIVYLAIQIFCK
jgi:hypothetical protein